MASSGDRDPAGPGIPASALRTVLDEAAAWYREQLGAPAAAAAVALLADRGLVDLTVDTPAGRRWTHGYAPSSTAATTSGAGGGLCAHLRRLGHLDAVLLAAGVAVPSRGGGVLDALRDRLVLPLHDPDGVVGFTGRRLADPTPQQVSAGRVPPKWLNNASTALYRKGAHLYGVVEQAAELAAGRGLVVLVEGPLDAVAVNLAGHIGLAAGGTALTADHLSQLLAAAGIDRPIHVAYDADPAGSAATVRAALLLTGHPAVQVLLESGQDPAGLLADHGARGLRRALHHTRPLVDAAVEDRLTRWERHLQTGNIAAAVDAVRDLAPLINSAPAGEHARLVVLLADRAGLPAGQVTALVLDALTSA